ncbi:SGNH/GDSL hydrolase family protein [Alkalibacterium kapii]|uniref:Lipase n=1 Tax=Alkalibacterium kapii TaxID=426704 RepID=A0A511ARR5_9LACT|nr:SGNH/GDSL hydrolase family protein [Alkalibacterium kapii]GEK90442.1 lipase [Alkalibacterium kapii]
MKIITGDTLLFIGDSITDGGRDKVDPTDLGRGFPLLIFAYLQTIMPEKRLTCLNRGVAGDTISDLKSRWETDCLDIDPDVVTLLIGINDTGSNQNQNKQVTKEELESFESDYRFLLKSLHQRTDARVVLMEPFVLPYPKDRMIWRNDLDPRIQIVRKMAKEYQAELIPLDGLLNTQGIKNGFSYYTGEDGVHPTVAGHGYIAKTWLETVLNKKVL